MGMVFIFFLAVAVTLALASVWFARRGGYSWEKQGCIVNILFFSVVIGRLLLHI